MEETNNINNLETPNNGDLLKDLPKQYKFKGLTVNVEREFKTEGKNCVDLLIEMIDRKKKEINKKQLTEV